MTKYLLLIGLLLSGCSAVKETSCKVYIGPGEYESCLEWCEYDKKWVAYVAAQYDGNDSRYFCRCTDSESESEMGGTFHYILEMSRRKK